MNHCRAELGVMAVTGRMMLRFGIGSLARWRTHCAVLEVITGAVNTL